MDPELLAILDRLDAPGRTLAFCDETNLTEGATATLVAHLRLHAAFVIDAASYAAAAAPLAAFLAGHGLPEFHAAEIVNGKDTSPWKQVPMALRLEALERAGTALGAAGTRVAYLYISKEQYAGMVAEAGGAIPADYREGLKQAFFRSLADYLPVPAVLVADRAKNTPGPTLCSFPGGETLVGGGAILVESHKVIGLQIADMAAYAVRRYLARRTKIYAGNADPFDEIVTACTAALHERFDHLLTVPALAA